MSDIVQVAIIASIAPTLAALGAVIASLRNHEKLKVIEKATNGMSKRLEEAAQAKGNLEGRAEQIAENKSKQ